MSVRLLLLLTAIVFLTAIVNVLPAASGQTFKTAWGDPDLQGMWPGNMGVPLQRPESLGTRTTLSDAEFAQKEAQARKQADADSQSTSTSDSKATIGPPSYWVERGTPSRQTSLIVDPPNGRLPPLTAEEQKLRKEARAGKGFPGEWRGQADSYDDLNVYYRCITRGVLGSIIPVIYNNGNEILQAPGQVIIRNEMIHETRIIPLDGRPHPSPKIRQYMGDSRGHWEGNTLVIDTTNFTDKDAIGSNGAGYPGDPGHHSTDLKLTERLTRVDANTLNYQATIDDPKTWTQPWTILISLKRDDKYQLFEYACHEGNIAMSDILSGARSDELKGDELKGDELKGDEVKPKK
jgi:hypothetical protein